MWARLRRSRTVEAVPADADADDVEAAGMLQWLPPVDDDDRAQDA